MRQNDWRHFHDWIQMTPMSKMTPIKMLKITLKIEIGDTGQIGDILSIEGGGGSFLFECYHNDCDFCTNDEKDYHRHAVQKHTGIPVLYPSKTELEKYSLKPQGKSWEV